MDPFSNCSVSFFILLLFILLTTTTSYRLRGRPQIEVNRRQLVQMLDCQPGDKWIDQYFIYNCHFNETSAGYEFVPTDCTDVSGSPVPIGSIFTANNKLQFMCLRNYNSAAHKLEDQVCVVHLSSDANILVSSADELLIYRCDDTTVELHHNGHLKEESSMDHYCITLSSTTTVLPLLTPSTTTKLTTSSNQGLAGTDLIFENPEQKQNASNRLKHSQLQQSPTRTTTGQFVPEMTMEQKTTTLVPVFVNSSIYEVNKLQQNQNHSSNSDKSASEEASREVHNSENEVSVTKFFIVVSTEAEDKQILKDDADNQPLPTITPDVTSTDDSNVEARRSTRSKPVLNVLQNINNIMSHHHQLAVVPILLKPDEEAHTSGPEGKSTEEGEQRELLKKTAYEVNIVAEHDKPQMPLSKVFIRLKDHPPKEHYSVSHDEVVDDPIEYHDDGKGPEIAIKKDTKTSNAVIIPLKDKKRNSDQKHYEGTSTIEPEIEAEVEAETAQALIQTVKAGSLGQETQEEKIVEYYDEEPTTTVPTGGEFGSTTMHWWNAFLEFGITPPCPTQPTLAPADEAYCTDRHHFCRYYNEDCKILTPWWRMAEELAEFRAKSPATSSWLLRRQKRRRIGKRTAVASWPMADEAARLPNEVNRRSAWCKKPPTDLIIAMCPRQCARCPIDRTWREGIINYWKQTEIFKIFFPEQLTDDELRNLGTVPNKQAECNQTVATAVADQFSCAQTSVKLSRYLRCFRADSLADCQSRCLRSSPCVAVTYDLNQRFSAGGNCYLFGPQHCREERDDSWQTCWKRI